MLFQSDKFLQTIFETCYPFLSYLLPLFSTYTSAVQYTEQELLANGSFSRQLFLYWDGSGTFFCQVPG
ncbi:MAG: hypothetical protein M0Q26_03130 [Chitinophagaceae bacterium]|nr:hypothetical protein [Chitinophagaceae bacterium]MDP1762893.1 hypothetical protein [Sediminibacterium sp.]MDP1812697.1 hypothetical protein [Sediminibacterium sp.]MDP3127584.1 hypothetical protein [Sediminibacterium sp.]